MRKTKARRALEQSFDQHILCWGAKTIGQWRRRRGRHYINSGSPPSLFASRATVNPCTMIENRTTI
ncbi:hypothetical protein SAMN04488526_1538 [Jannaschia helgolandensis]|uniref:Uncharacterized protein n=1 Tax=Jannaschia helgolandensis TaxID=188906 RepID=A0A1H7KZD0_9RHOB|nr:hypothetical protein SAMN04488526_1538 [Jannaschia helgolandensis]